MVISIKDLFSVWLLAHIYNLSYGKLWVEHIFRTDWELGKRDLC